MCVQPAQYVLHGVPFIHNTGEAGCDHLVTDLMVGFEVILETIIVNE